MPDSEFDDQFVALLMANQSRVYRFLVTLVPSRADAEDLYQQTCITLWKSREKYDPEVGSFVSWACAIANNHVRNFRRREATRQNLLSEEAAQSLIVTRAAHASLLDEWHRALGGCLERLTPHQRHVVEESYGERKLKESAAREGRTPNALYKMLRHIRGLLHDCIQKTVTDGGVA